MIVIRHGLMVEMMRMPMLRMNLVAMLYLNRGAGPQGIDHRDRENEESVEEMAHQELWEVRRLTAEVTAQATGRVFCFKANKPFELKNLTHFLFGHQ